jgi:hypothetical protein
MRMEQGRKMPVLRYFMFVGGALLALLLIANVWLPAVPSTEDSHPAIDRSVIRIHSDHKWPERVVFDTTRPTITPAPASVPAPAVVAEVPSPPKSENDEHSKGHVRQAFAQLRPNSSPDEHRDREQKRKRRPMAVAKSHRVWPQRMMVAQQPPFFLFGGNSVW